MFNRRTATPIIDLLFNLLLSFVALFCLSFLLINDTSSENSVDSESNFLISMRWDANCDVDLWLLLPDGRKVFYANRDEAPAHLDVDVRLWRSFGLSGKRLYVIQNNEEIISIQGILQGEYAVNAHLFSSNGYDSVEVEVIVQDVKNGNVIYAGKKTVSPDMEQQHFVRFTVNAKDGYEYDVVDVYTDRPIFFVEPPEEDEEW